MSRHCGLVHFWYVKIAFTVYSEVIKPYSLKPLAHFELRSLYYVKRRHFFFPYLYFWSLPFQYSTRIMKYDTI